jgi:hypothetical protein
LETVTYDPVRALNSTLFPTLGLPTRATRLTLEFFPGASVFLPQHVAIIPPLYAFDFQFQLYLKKIYRGVLHAAHKP